MAITEAPVAGNAEAEGEFAYVLIPVAGCPGEHVALFEDGSYAAWTPAGAITNGGR